MILGTEARIDYTSLDFSIRISRNFIEQGLGVAFAQSVNLVLIRKSSDHICTDPMVLSLIVARRFPFLGALKLSLAPAS